MENLICLFDHSILHTQLLAFNLQMLHPPGYQCGQFPGIAQSSIHGVITNGFSSFVKDGTFPKEISLKLQLLVGSSCFYLRPEQVPGRSYSSTLVPKISTHLIVQFITKANIRDGTICHLMS